MKVHDIIKETVSGSFATSMGGGNGFANGGPGTTAHVGTKKKKPKPENSESKMIRRIDTK